MTDAEILKRIIEMYARSANAFAAYLGLKSAQTLYDILKGRNGISRDLADAITAKCVDLNRAWLLTGEGEMLKQPLMPEGREKQISDFTLVPMVPVRAKAGYLFGYGDSEYIETLPTIPVITDRTFHGKYRCFEVEGDSMDDGTRDAICDKDIIMAREVRRELWKYKLHYKDWNFVIVHKEGMLIKSIVDHDTECGVITCHSVNPLYGADFKVDLRDVYELYNIIRIVDRSTKK